MEKEKLRHYKGRMRERFVMAGELLGKMKGEQAQSYINMINTLNRLMSMSSDDSTDFEELRKELQLLEEQAVQYIREQRFKLGYSIAGAEDVKKNEELFGSLPENFKRKNEVKAANVILAQTKSWMNELDVTYPDIKKREMEAQAQKLEEEKKQEDTINANYAEVIHLYDGKFAEAFVPDKNSEDPLYNAASSAFRKLMYRMHREHPKLDEHLYIKQNLKATLKTMSAFVWNIRNQYGMGEGTSFNNVTNLEQNQAAAEKIEDPVLRKKIRRCCRNDKLYHKM